MFMNDEGQFTLEVHLHKLLLSKIETSAKIYTHTRLRMKIINKKSRSSPTGSKL